MASKVNLSAASTEPGFVTRSRARVEETLLASVRTDDPFLTEVASHLIKAGGKRQRPLFAVAASLAATAGPDGDGSAALQASQEAVAGGVAVELVHLGSLYHDDVIDEATTRRTVESVNSRWGNLTAILAGDFLLAKASEIAASLGTEVAGLLARTIGWLCEGEVLEIQSTFDGARTTEAYLRSIEGKTASLFATACRIGGIVADLPRDQIEALTTFGRNYGMAFQIVDDVLDLTATAQELGKPAGHDLLEGVYTLPVLWLRDAQPDGEVAAALGTHIQPEDHQRLLDLVRASDGIAHAQEAIGRYVADAHASLAGFDAPSVQWLRDIATNLTTLPTR